MKLAGAAVGVFACWVLTRWVSPAIACDIGNGQLPSAAIVGIASLLSVLWLTAYTRIASFEKLEHLRNSQREKIMGKSSDYKRVITTSITVNAVVAVLCLVANELSNLPSGAPVKGVWLAYLILGSCGMWLGGLFQSKHLLNSIEETRTQVALAQEKERKRVAYAAQLQADILKSPLDTTTKF